MSTYGGLYDRIRKKFSEALKQDSFEITDEYCRENGIYFPTLKKHLEDWGCHDDAEVLLNCPGRIPRHAVVGGYKANPNEWAIQQGMFCRWAGGRWQSCDASDSNAVPDRNAAIIHMIEVGVAGE